MGEEERTRGGGFRRGTVASPSGDGLPVEACFRARRQSQRGDRQRSTVRSTHVLQAAMQCPPELRRHCRSTMREKVLLLLLPPYLRVWGLCSAVLVVLGGWLAGRLVGSS